MPMDVITVRLELARSLRAQSQHVSEFQMKHYGMLDAVQRLELAMAIQRLDARAADLLHDALEEGAAEAEILIERIEASTKKVRDAIADIEPGGGVYTAVRRWPVGGGG